MTTDKLDQVAADGLELESALSAIPPAPGEQAAAPAGATMAPGDEERIATLALVPKLIGKALAIALPEIAPAYSVENCRMWGEAANEVAKKRGWKVDDSPEVALVATTVMLFALPTGMAIAKRIQEKKKEKKPDAPAGNAAHDGAAAAATAAAGEEISAP